MNVRLKSGMVRGSTEGKIDYLLVRDGPMFERWAAHLTANAEDKGKRNWLNAHDAEDLARFRESAARHFEQWLRGDTDEDHAAALFFNVNGAEYVHGRRSKLSLLRGESHGDQESEAGGTEA